MDVREIAINSEFITLGQFLKFAQIIGNGGEAKSFLLANDPLVNGEVDKRRGRKLRPGDKVVVSGAEYLIVT